MSFDFPYIHRDISWLSFNERVLQEAKDPNVPLMERIKFLAIYSNNLDEFFRVRMANHRNLVRVGKKTKRELEFDPKTVVKQINSIVNKHQIEFSRIFRKEIIPALKKQGITLKRRLELNEEQSVFVEDYFTRHMLPYAQPVLLIKNKVRPFLNNAALYLTVLLQDKDDPSLPNQYGIVKIPSDHLPRFVVLPSPENEKHIIMLDDMVRQSVSWMFPGFEILDTYSIKLTRDAELYIDDEFSGDLKEKIRSSLSKRSVGPPSRFVYDREMPTEFLKFLKDSFDLNKYDLIKEGRYHNNSDFFQFPDFGMKNLLNTPLPPLSYPPLEESTNFFHSIYKKDHLLHVPYHSYESVIRFFEEAADDPKVTAIKIVQYRVASKSRIMNALMKAVRKGKHVTVFVEVKARFDEKANLEWGEKLEAAGVKVHYSFPGVKVHSKLALVYRTERRRTKLYAYLGTGNFHEGTAKIYSDIGLFTADKRLTKEAAQVFAYLEDINNIPIPGFKHLLVGQFNLRPALVDMINREIKNAKAGKPAAMILKMNSLQDPDMISKLYEASQAGVKIQLIVRGICCLVPQVPGLSDNIEAISIVDRYLEHARIFVFHNNGNEKIYLSSADWMVRNLSYRIETIFPIYSPEYKAQILEFLNLQLKDNQKARIIDAKQKNVYKKIDPEKPFQSQWETYWYLAGLQEKNE